MFFNKENYKAKFAFVTSSFVNEDHHACASRLIETVRSFITTNIHCLTNDNLEIEIEKNYLNILNKYKVDLKKAFIWKPWLILSQLNRLSSNGILFYLDAGSEIAVNSNSLFELNRLIKMTLENGSTFFRNNYDSTIVADKEAMNILNKYITNVHNPHHSVAAGVLILRNDINTISTVRRWCYLSLINSGFIFTGSDNSKLQSTINPYERQHRHDQVVLSAILFDKKITLSKYPIWFNGFLYFYSSTLNYPIHNNRNKTSISFIDSFIFFKKISFLRFINFFRLGNLILNILYFLKKKLKTIFYRNIISPELLSYSRDQCIQNLNYFKTKGDHVLLYNDRRLIKGLNINNSFVFNDGSVFKNKSNKFLISHSRLYGNRSIDKFNLFFYLKKFNKKKINSGVLCLNKDSGNLYHFLFDCLVNSLDYFDKNKVVLLGEGLLNLKKQLFNTLSYDFLIIKQYQSVYVNNLNLYDLPDYSGEPSVNSIFKLKFFFEEKFTSIKKKNKKNYLIQRTEREGRSLQFTKDQIDILKKKFDFEFIDLSVLSLYEQIEIFRSARNIIGASGSGLSWIFLCGKDSNIIEIRTVVNENTAIEKIARGINLNYYFYYGNSIYNKLNSSNPNLLISDFLFSEILTNIK
jgi:hypothetical protein